MPARRLYQLVQAVNALQSPDDLTGCLLSGMDWLTVSAVLIGQYLWGGDDFQMRAAGVSADYVARYEERRYDRASSVVAALRATHSPIIWNLDLPRPAPSSAVAEIEAGARAEGLTHGISVPCWKGDRFAGWVVFATNSPPQHDTTALFSFQLLGLAAFDKLLLLTEPKASDVQVLTPREFETLELAADGQSTKEMARVLKVSSRTVEFHMKNIAAKLGASNKTHSVAKAISMGLINGARGN